jgi:hypothetical protein
VLAQAADALAAGVADDSSAPLQLLGGEGGALPGALAPALSGICEEPGQPEQRPQQQQPQQHAELYVLTAAAPAPATAAGPSSQSHGSAVGLPLSPNCRRAAGPPAAGSPVAALQAGSYLARRHATSSGGGAVLQAVQALAAAAVQQQQRQQRQAAAAGEHGSKSAPLRRMSDIGVQPQLPGALAPEPGRGEGPFRRSFGGFFGSSFGGGSSQPARAPAGQAAQAATAARDGANMATQLPKLDGV